MNELSTPFFLEISLIDEDPEQPRTSENPGFSEESIAELAQTIKERGVKSPISVREDGNGRYIINHGARRYRASKYAGLETIPAFIDNDYSKLDQVIENIQREELGVREIADYIGYRLSRGSKKKELAAELGKSNAWVSQYAALLTMPEAIAEAMSKGKIRDLTAINELIKIYNQCPVDIGNWISEEKEISRATINTMKDYVNSLLDKKEEIIEKTVSDKNKQGKKGPKPTLYVDYNGVKCQVKMTRVSAGKIIIIMPNLSEEEVAAEELKLLCVE